MSIMTSVFREDIAYVMCSWTLRGLYGWRTVIKKKCRQKTQTYFRGNFRAEQTC